MQLANAMHVAAGIEQGARDLDVPCRGGQCSAQVCPLPRAHWDPRRAERRPHRLEMTLLRRRVQPGPPAVCPPGLAARTSRVVRELLAQDGDVACCAGLEERVGGFGRHGLGDWPEFYGNAAASARYCFWGGGGGGGFF